MNDTSPELRRLAQLFRDVASTDELHNTYKSIADYAHSRLGIRV